MIFKKFLKKNQSLQDLMGSYRKVEKRITEIETEKGAFFDDAISSGDLDKAKKGNDLDVELQMCRHGLERLKGLMVESIQAENFKNYEMAEKKLAELDAQKEEATKKAGADLGRAVASCHGLGDSLTQKLAGLIREAYVTAKKGLKDSEIEIFDRAYISEMNAHSRKVIDYKGTRRKLKILMDRVPGGDADHAHATVTVARFLDPNYEKQGIVDVGKFFPKTV